MYQRGRLPNQSEIISPDSGSKAIRNAAKKEFEDFVTAVLERLSELESKQTGRPSSLKVFCRIDVSVILGQDNRASYFVNEVERTNTASLWSALHKKPNTTMVNDFHMALARWVEMWKGEN